MVLYGNTFYIYGGYDGITRFGDLHKCSVTKGFKWKLIIGGGDCTPLNRFGHCAVVIEHSMIVFGGWNGHDTMDDLYHYSFGKIFDH